MEVNRRASEQQRKVKERAGEAKRIQDLERQVRHTALLSYSLTLRASRAGIIQLCLPVIEYWQLSNHLLPIASSSY